MKCPICQKRTVKEWAPFCSKTCKDLDLINWLDGRYVVPGESVRAVDSHDEDDQD